MKQTPALRVAALPAARKAAQGGDLRQLWQLAGQQEKKNK